MFRKKKNYHVHPITVGLRTQLCKDCHDFERRRCEVEGKPALFHCWVEDDQALLKINTFCPPSEHEFINRRFRADGVIPGGCSAEVIRCTFSLVEYQDGTVGKVKPEAVRFIVQEG